MAGGGAVKVAAHVTRMLADENEPAKFRRDGGGEKRGSEVIAGWKIFFVRSIRPFR